jgi:hypothetical protein
MHDLLFADVCADDEIEMRRQAARRLAISGRAVPGDPTQRSEGDKRFEELGRVRRSRRRVLRRLTGEQLTYAGFRTQDFGPLSTDAASKARTAAASQGSCARRTR